MENKRKTPKDKWQENPTSLRASINAFVGNVLVRMWMILEIVLRRIVRCIELDRIKIKLIYKEKYYGY